MSTTTTSATAGQGDDDPAVAPTSPVPWKWLYILSVVLIGLFFIGGIAMIALADTPEAVWRNRFAVYSGFQAIVFTAVGWLFGREVHRGEAAVAKASEAQAKEGERAATQEAANGRALAAAVTATTQPTAPPRTDGHAHDIADDDRPASATADGAAQLSMLRSMARSLYPSM
jgi:hypothetical protein